MRLSLFDHQSIQQTVAVCVATTAALLGGCSASPSQSASPYSASDGGRRDTTAAIRLTAEAADLIDSDPEQAEALLREALAADLFHGPAHNNLGVIHLGRGNLYEAANEFEWARRLMPGHPDPRINLGLALERAGRVDEAITEYRTALEVYPGHLPAMQSLARCQLRNGREDAQTPRLLADIALRGNEAWRAWAQSWVSTGSVD